MMFKTFETFKKKLDEIMIQCINQRIVLYGYDRTGQFLEWYAEYYHSIKIDYIVTDDWSSGNIPYNFPIFRESLFNFNYKDVKDAVVWIATDNTDGSKSQFLEKYGYVENSTYFDFRKIIYGNDVINLKKCEGIFAPKTGIRDVQFIEYLEYIHDVNFVAAVYSENFLNSLESAHSYCITTQKEIFPILDKLHFHPKESDAIFDFGCGKGGAMLTFLDYGFKNVGGVEYEDGLYEVAVDNYKKLDLLNSEDINVELLHADASKLEKELDKYNFFYYFDPFEESIFVPTIQHICESYERKPRHITVICINPTYCTQILETGKFNLTNSFITNTKQKVCNIFEVK